jgi:Tol biopolymer transport system component
VSAKVLAVSRLLRTLGVFAAALACACAASAAARGPERLAEGIAPTWAPDGNGIAYLGGYEPSAKLVVMARDGSGRRVVATASSGTGLGEVRFAGQRLVFYNVDKFEVLSVALTGGRVMRLGATDLPGNPGEPFAVSPNEKMIAYESPRTPRRYKLASAIRIVGVAGGRVRTLPLPVNASDAFPAFSPDGRDIVFSRLTYKSWDSPRGYPQLMIQPSSGGPAHSLGVHGELPQWSPNGKWIAYQGWDRKGFGGALVLVAAVGGAPRVLVDKPKGSSVDAFSWAPDSSKLAFVSNERLATVDLSGALTMLTSPGFAVDLHTPQWSPDGSEIAFGALGDHSTDGVEVVRPS